MSAPGWFLLGAPWDSSCSGRGEAGGPAALRRAGLARVVRRDLGDVATSMDSGERDPRTGVLGLEASVRSARLLATALQDAMVAWPTERPLVVGGDCSILLGIVPALRRRVGPVGLWFLDGHPDFLDGARSETGELADMDLAVLTGVGAEPLTTLTGEPPMISAEDVVLLGHRTTGLDAAAAEEVALLPAAMRRIDADAVVRDPVGAGAQAAAWLAHAGAGAWLHIDLDVLDPVACPAVTYPQPGGPDWDELEGLLRPLTSSPRLLGVSVADLRADLDPSGAVAARLVELLGRVLT